MFVLNGSASLKNPQIFSVFLCLNIDNTRFTQQNNKIFVDQLGHYMESGNLKKWGWVSI